MGKIGAIGAIIIFIISIYFAIPSEANIGYLIVDTLAKTSPIESNIIAQQEFMWKALFSLFSILITLGDIVYIINQVKKGNF